ncbi:uncharacterized protein LOC110811010 [Carica papaya]|uniref:uncharacterized protein LOC110811010 n=1 Tax=Carica papaya TaxID=3649 RepID=UPI000B8D1A8D|nr:uncharacterized protein LOC110811010 [Carica papaya]
MVKLQSLCRDFEMLQMKTGESVQEFLLRVATIVNQMRSYEEEISDQTSVVKVLRSLTPRFDHARLNRVNEKTEEKAFQVMGESPKQQDDSRQQVKDVVEEVIKAEADCWKRKKQANYVKDEEEIKLFMAYQDGTKASSGIWFLDSGCSNHMTGIKSLFKELDESCKVKVRLGDDEQMQVEGKGTVALSNGHGNTKLLHNVYFVPALSSQNLLSIGQFMASGYSIMFDDVSCVIRNKKSN